MEKETKKEKKVKTNNEKKNGVAIFGKGFNSIFVLDKKAQFFLDKTSFTLFKF